MAAVNILPSVKMPLPATFTSAGALRNMPSPVPFATGGSVPGAALSFTYFQRVYDSTAGWCQYSTPDAPNASPAPGDTTPNHTNNLIAAAHEVTSAVES